MVPTGQAVRRENVATAARDPSHGRSRVACGVLVVLSIFPTAVAAQMSVQPVILEMRAGGGSTVSTVSIRNEGTTPIPMRAYVADFDQPADGSHTFLDAGEHERSCAKRLRVFPESFELEPGRTQEVSLTMAPGDRTCWSLVFVQTVPRDTTGISVAQRIGVKVYGVRPGAATEGELRSVSLEPAGSGPGALLRLEFENLGEDPLRPEGELEIRTLDGNVVGVATIPAFSVLPGRIRRAEVSLELDLPGGEYLAIPILDFGGEYLAGGQTVFRVPEG